MQGHKETEGKLEYELDWDFIQAMAERMQLNKGKYEPYNWQKPMDVDKLKQALFRHTIDVMRGVYDDTSELDHLSAIACNAMMLWYQLKCYRPSVVYSEVNKPTITPRHGVVFDSEDIPLKSQWIEKETVGISPVEVQSMERIGEYGIVNVKYINGRGSSMCYKISGFLRIYEPYVKVD